MKSLILIALTFFVSQGHAIQSCEDELQGALRQKAEKMTGVVCTIADDAMISSRKGMNLVSWNIEADCKGTTVEFEVNQKLAVSFGPCQFSGLKVLTSEADLKPADICPLKQTVISDIEAVRKSDATATEKKQEINGELKVQRCISSTIKKNSSAEKVLSLRGLVAALLNASNSKKEAQTVINEYLK